ncbi:MAG: sulfotransferase domain-containing protein [Nannocystaceae bacterium]
MSTFTDPPLLSPNTIMATVMRAARGLGLALPAVRTLLGHAQSEARKAKVFAGYEPAEHDVFVTTYSKSGTNWAMQMAVQIAWRGQAEFEHIHELVAWPESPLAGVVALDDPGPWERCPTGKRGIKTNIDAPFVPYSPQATYLTVIRDPKDVLVSAYHFLSGVFDLVDDVTVEQWLELFLGPQFPAGPWPQHTASFWEWRDRPNVAVLLFPHMKADLPAAVRKAAAAMRVELTEAELSRVVERCSFQWMKEHEPRFAPPRLLFTRQRATMIRAGKVAAGAELLSDEQRARIDRWCQAELLRLGSDFPYAEVFDVVDAPDDPAG